MNSIKFIILILLIQACGNPTSILDSNTQPKVIDYKKPEVENKYCYKCGSLMFNELDFCMNCNRITEKERRNSNNDYRNEERLVLLTCIECGGEYEEYDDSEELCEDCLAVKLKKEKLKKKIAIKLQKKQKMMMNKIIN